MRLALKLVPQPASMDRRIQLLELAGAAPERAGITLDAFEYKNKNYTDAKTMLRNRLDQELFVGVEELHGIGKTTVGGRPFYYYETRRGIDQHVVLAAEMDGYVLSANLQARDPKMVRELMAAFSRMEFFPPKEAKDRAGAQAKLYQGPAISAQHLREVREALPGQHIDPGKVKGRVYSNDQIGMTYEFPAGWHVEPEGAVEPSVERYREKVLGEPLLGPREKAVVKACRRTLLSVWRSKPQSDGEVPYDDFGEVTLSTMPLACFPNIHFPEDSRGRRGRQAVHCRVELYASAAARHEHGPDVRSGRQDVCVDARHDRLQRRRRGAFPTHFRRAGDDGATWLFADLAVRGTA